MPENESGLEGGAVLDAWLDQETADDHATADDTHDAETPITAAPKAEKGKAKEKPVAKADSVSAAAKTLASQRKGTKAKAKPEVIDLRTMVPKKGERPIVDAAAETEEEEAEPDEADELADGVEGEEAAEDDEGEGAEALSDIKPFEFKAYTERGESPLTLPGSLEKPGVGVFVPDGEGTTALRQAIARANKYPALVQRNEQLRETVQQSITRDGLENKAIANVLASRFHPETFAKWVTDAAKNPAMALRELRAELRDANVGLKEQFAGRILTGSSPDGDRQESEQQAMETLYHELDAALAHPDLVAAFHPKARAEITERILKQPGRYIVTADRDYRDPATGRGWTKGQLLVNKALIADDLRYEARLRSGNGNGTRPSQVVPVRTRNEARRQTQVGAPPAATAKPVQRSPQAAKPSGPVRRDRGVEEIFDSMMSIAMQE